MTLAARKAVEQAFAQIMRARRPDLVWAPRPTAGERPKPKDGEKT